MGHYRTTDQTTVPNAFLIGWARVDVGYWHFSDVSDQADDVGFIEVKRTSQLRAPKSKNDPWRASGSGAVAIATIKSVPFGKVQGCWRKGQCVHLFASLDWLWRG
jgi:hypothetical protein